MIPPTLDQEHRESLKNSAELFNSTITKNDLNDSFDETKLLSFVPKSKLKNAKELLQIFDDRSSELTWNSSGVIFIDQIAIPNSNIFYCFPFLFKQKPPKNLQGFNDFLNKIVDMGLSHYIAVKHNKKIDLPQTNLTDFNEKKDDVPWWYLGQ